MKIVLWLVGAFVVFVVLMNVFQTPEMKQRADARAAISRCWDEQGKKSHSPEAARFIAGACEKMEADFQAKWQVSP
jgi:hypothetical protein